MLINAVAKVSAYPVPVYVDMDGTIVNFEGEPNALKRFDRENNFFYNLAPMPKNLKAVNDLLACGSKVYIITSSPNGRADYDKMRWLRKYMPLLPYDDIIIVPLGSNKADYMKTATGILFDDYGKNLVQWIGKTTNNRAVKVKQDGDILDGLRWSLVSKTLIIND